MLGMWNFVPLVVLLLTGPFLSSCDQQKATDFLEKEEVRTVEAVNQLAILEILEILRRDGTPSCYPEMEDQLQSLRTEFETRFTELQESLLQMKMEFNNTEQETRERLANLESKVEDLPLNITEGQRGCVTKDGIFLSVGENVDKGCYRLKCEEGSIITESAPVGFQEISDGCYLADTSSARSWEDQKDYCIGRSSRLAKPPSDMEAFKSFLLGLRDGYYGWWLGARRGDDGEFRYISDGSPLQASDWAVGEPDSDEACALIDPKRGDRVIYSYPCNQKYFVVCEYTHL